MAPDRAKPTGQLPIVPVELLKRHHVHEKYDTRFRACARLLQALWRERQDLPIGWHDSRAGRRRRIGSLIGAGAAQAGRNFLLPAVAQLARREVIYQEPGAFIEQGRLFRNLLSSAGLAFNLCAPLRFDPQLAARVLRSLIPDLDLATVTDVRFEHSPGRRDRSFTGDRSAFDVAICYTSGAGARGFLGIEIKYSESLTETAPADPHPRYEELADSSGLYRDPATALLRVGAAQQLFREHLLTQATLMQGLYDEARFILIAPRHNDRVQHAADRYAAHLVEPTTGKGLCCKNREA